MSIAVLTRSGHSYRDIKIQSLLYNRPHLFLIPKNWRIGEGRLNEASRVWIPFCLNTEYRKSSHYSIDEEQLWVEYLLYRKKFRVEERKRRQAF